MIAPARRRALALLLATLPLGARALMPGPQARLEIEHLFVHLEASGCEFYRNGSWHDAAAASAHLRGKYQALLDKGLVGSAEDFIERGASRSSVSGQAYQVRCGSAPAIDSAAWFNAELLRARAAAPSR